MSQSTQSTQSTPPTSPNKKLEDMTKAQLEHLKLISEIKSLKKPFYKEPAFWTLVIAVTATLYSWKSGLFEIKSEQLKLDTSRLEEQKKTLTDEKKKLLKTIDSLKNKIGYYDNQNNQSKATMEKMKLEEVSIKKAYTIAKEKIQTRKELKITVTNFLKDMYNFLYTYRINESKQSEIARNKTSETIKNLYDRTPNRKDWSKADLKTIDSLQDVEMTQIELLYNEEKAIWEQKYVSFALLYRKKILSFQPELVKLSPEEDYPQHVNDYGYYEVYVNLSKLNNALKD